MNKMGVNSVSQDARFTEVSFISDQLLDSVKTFRSRLYHSHRSNEDGCGLPRFLKRYDVGGL